MRPRETITALAAFEGRGPGTDAERRAAQWLARELVRQPPASPDRDVLVPSELGARARVARRARARGQPGRRLSHPTIGVALLAVALVSTIVDDVAGRSLGRRLTPERASQNVIATARPPGSGPGPAPPARLIVTANYDAGRTGLIYRDPVRATAAPPTTRHRRRHARLARAGSRSRSPTSWRSRSIRIDRSTTRRTRSVSSSCRPAVALVLALALLLDASGAGYGPGRRRQRRRHRGRTELARTLRRPAPAPTRPDTSAVGLELVLQGAGEDEQTRPADRYRTPASES